jgi:hypothetical protein
MTKVLTAAKKAEASATSSRKNATNDSSLPLWKDQAHRVQGAMWRHSQEDGKTRFTVSISRSYKDKADDEWKNVHYYDEKDLDDVMVMAQTAKEEILRQRNLVFANTED